MDKRALAPMPVRERKRHGVDVSINRQQSDKGGSHAL
jgi:hypothetical protein